MESTTVLQLRLLNAMYWISEQFIPIPLLQTEYKSAQLHVVNLNVFICVYIII